MSSLPVNRYRRRSKDNEVNADTFGNDFEWFDPWRDTNLNAPTSFRWINQLKQPTAYEEKTAPALQLPTYGDKYRIKLDISDFDHDTIKTTIEGRLLIIEAKKKHHHHHHSNHENDKERKLYDLPELVYEHADAEHLVSYVTPNNILIVDIPLHNHEHKRRYLETTSSQTNDSHHLRPYGQHRDQSFNYHHFHTSTFTPTVVDVEGQKKKLQMTLPMKNYRPEQVKVSIKNNDLIVQGEHLSIDNRHQGRTYFYKSITLPPGTQTDDLQSHLTHDGHLQIEAPYTEHMPKN